MKAWKLRFSTAMVLGLLLVMGVLKGHQTAAADNGLVVAVDPGEVSLPLGNQAALTLNVQGGVNVNAFDLTLIYDAQRLSLAAWLHGGYLNNVTCLYMVNEPGFLQLACTQVAQPGVNGDGVLLELVFNTMALGQAEVLISNVEFADPAGVKTFPERQNGVVNVLDLPTYTVIPVPSPTSTQLPTETATQTPTHTPTIVPTATTSPTAEVTETAVPSTATETPLPTALATEAAAMTATEAFALTETEAADEPQLRWPAGTATPEGGSIKQTQAAGETQTAAETLAAHLATLEGEQGINETDTSNAGGMSETSTWLAGLLWGGLVLGSGACLIMLIIAIRRKNNKSEDYLL